MTNTSYVVSYFKLSISPMVLTMFAISPENKSQDDIISKVSMSRCNCRKACNILPVAGFCGVEVVLKAYNGYTALSTDCTVYTISSSTRHVAGACSAFEAHVIISERPHESGALMTTIESVGTDFHSTAVQHHWCFDKLGICHRRRP
jgi:hypothetical protein